LHNLNFERLVNYDAGKVGITLDVEIRLGNTSANFEAKIDTVLRLVFLNEFTASKSVWKSKRANDKDSVR